MGNFILVGLEGKNSGGEMNSIIGNILTSSTYAFRINSQFTKNTVSLNQLKGANGDIFVGTGTVGNNFLNNYLASETIVGSYGGYDYGHVKVGRNSIWVDGVGELRVKTGVPTSDTDGTIILKKTSMRTYAGNPNGIQVPAFLGEELRDTTNNRWYKAAGLSNTSWEQLSTV